jgi:hypothetical protein
MGNDILGTSKRQPLLPGSMLASAWDGRVMDQPMRSEVVGPPEWTFAVQQVGRAKGGKSFRKKQFRAQPWVPAMAQSNGQIDLVALEVCQTDRGGDSQVDVGVSLIESRQSRKEPLGGKGRRDTYRKRPRTRERGLAAGRPLEHLEASLEVRQHVHPRIGQGDRASSSVEQTSSEHFLERAYLLTDGARSNVKLLGGLAEA